MKTLDNALSNLIFSVGDVLSDLITTLDIPSQDKAAAVIGQAQILVTAFESAAFSGYKARRGYEIQNLGMDTKDAYDRAVVYLQRARLLYGVREA